MFCQGEWSWQNRLQNATGRNLAEECSRDQGPGGGSEWLWTRASAAWAAVLEDLTVRGLINPQFTAEARVDRSQPAHVSLSAPAPGLVLEPELDRTAPVMGSDVTADEPEGLDQLRDRRGEQPNSQTAEEGSEGDQAVDIHVSTVSGGVTASILASRPREAA